MNKRPEDYGIIIYEWNNGKLDVFQNVDLSNKYLTELPFQFGTVSGHFSCARNKLSSLKGSPFVIHGDFDCSINELISLENGPREVYGNFSIYKNKIKSLNNCPKIVKGHFSCQDNNILILDSFPEEIKGIFLIKNNPLKSLKKIPNCRNFISDLPTEEVEKMIKLEYNKNKIKSKMKYI